MNTNSTVDRQSAEERHVMSKIARRLMPILVVMFLISFIDRQNVGFAKLQMVHSLNMTETAFGLASSLFFIGYLLFEVPSTLALHRFGARVWLARIMLTWGVITVLMGFTTSMQVFCGLRLALGVAEAGFYPGVIYYLTLWFPQSYRARVLGIFTLGSALANMLGSLVGGWLLSLNGVWGLAGWQWVFIATGLPAVLVGIAVFRLLPASYQEARFLSASEKQIVAAAHEREKPAHAEHAQPWKALLDPRVMLFAATYMLMSTSLYGVTYWLPTLVKSFGVSSSVNGLLSMLPWALAVLLLLWLPSKLRRAKSILRAMAIVAALGTLGFLLSLLLPSTPLRFVALVFGGACIPLLYPCFWSMPPRYFTGARAAASVAAINSIGNLGGFFGQNLMPLAGKLTGTAFGPMIVPIVCLAVLGLGVVVAWGRSGRAMEGVPA
ncbi:sugar phosphate permease [Paraburkholderia silvatlantica]|uniref:Sugar phosphate permease n=2 Tax=Paraburkholderia silvatlantica TaxID=321895 RepID=A0A2U1A4U1_9BURK|nr:MFS transporter [Paraburkholderia silvatlantica]MBB2931599.1 sugar phosphate permease [Paraburkholderia silvatlantica]PVY26610.1 sugar phosphate permease [Paraburkholderia silvatlantica]PXW32875.1 sugar phosphate permease [Paraburkholderia silvatlantica]PYE13670.1 sugar phosphate permease [Paraburkholderia silvatlantica]TDQ81621.1 sugar phosphate permease [Paraburkholderia silvatlantica]